MPTELTVEQLYRICDPSTLGCETSAEVKELDTIIGQKRAVRSLRFGLDIKEKGFNIYLAGIPGTGRATALERYLTEFAAKKPLPSDWCYVNNFQNPVEPNALQLPAGKAVQFQQDMEQTVFTAIEDMRTAFESEEYSSHKTDLIYKIQHQ